MLQRMQQRVLSWDYFTLGSDEEASHAAQLRQLPTTFASFQARSRAPPPCARTRPLSPTAQAEGNAPPFTPDSSASLPPPHARCSPVPPATFLPAFKSSHLRCVSASLSARSTSSRSSPSSSRSAPPRSSEGRRASLPACSDAMRACCPALCCSGAGADGAAAAAS